MGYSPNGESTKPRRERKDRIRKPAPIAKPAAPPVLRCVEVAPRHISLQERAFFDDQFLSFRLIFSRLAYAVSPQPEVAARLGEHFIGKNVDALVVDFGPPASTFKMNSGDTSYIWQLGNQTNAAGGDCVLRLVSVR